MKTAGIFLIVLFMYLHASAQSRIVMRADSSVKSTVILLDDFKIKKGLKTIQENKSRIFYKTDTIPALSSGTYKVQYKTIFNEMRTVKVRLDGTNEQFVFLNPAFIDVQKDLRKSRIYKLEDGESFFISQYATFCGGHSNDTLTFKKIGTAVFASNSKGEIELTAKQISDVAAFEQVAVQADKVKEQFSCTTRNNYEIHFKDEVVKLSDFSCKWYGFSNLLHDFNLD